jgi:hypothetical protein
MSPILKCISYCIKVFGQDYEKTLKAIDYSLLFSSCFFSSYLSRPALFLLKVKTMDLTLLASRLFIAILILIPFYLHQWLMHHMCFSCLCVVSSTSMLSLPCCLQYSKYLPLLPHSL